MWIPLAVESLFCFRMILGGVYLPLFPSLIASNEKPEGCVGIVVFFT